MKQIKKLQIGKKGLTEEIIEQIKKNFKYQELIKIELLSSCCRDKEKAKEIAENLIKNLGKNFTYKLIGYVLSVRKWRKNKSLIL